MYTTYNGTDGIAGAGKDKLVVGATDAIDVKTGGKLLTNGTQATDVGAITDSTGGTPGTTFAAITAPAANATTSLTADMTAAKNAIASIATQLNALRTVLRGLGLTA